MANKKITELTELTTPAGADILPIVDDTAGTPTTKYVSATNLMTLAPVQTADIANFGPAFYSTVADTTTSRTLSDTDNGKVIFMTNASAISVTIPSTLSDGFNCTLVQGGAGKITVTAGTGVNLYNYNSYTTTAGQYAVMNIVPVASDSYAIEGDIITTPFANGFGASFDGTDDAITSTMSGLTLGSLSLWVKPNSDITSASSANCVIGDSGTFNPRIIGLGSVTGYLSGESICVNYGTGAFGATGITISSSSWNHIFVSWQTSSETNSGSAGYDFWFNGTKVTGVNAISGGTIPTSQATLATMSVGKRNNNSEYFAGKVDELAIWTGDVSSDISTIYNSGATEDLEDSNVVSTAPSVWYRYGDVSGDTSSGGGAPANGNTIDAIKNQINTSLYPATASGATYTNVN